jgi:hypothetical protein
LVRRLSWSEQGATRSRDGGRKRNRQGKNNFLNTHR